MIAVLAFFSSCTEPERREEISIKYPKGIIYEVHDFRNIDGTVYYDIKYRGEIFTLVKAWQIDFNYKVGDTIKTN